jgi:hypothetical protein
MQKQKEQKNKRRGVASGRRSMMLNSIVVHEQPVPMCHMFGWTYASSQTPYRDRISFEVRSESSV